MLQPTMNQVVRQAQVEIDRRASVRRAPKVIWSGLTETAADFAVRIAQLRKTWKGRILAATPFGYEVPAGVHAVPFAPKMFWLLHPSVASRYRAGSGGRGSGKSHGFATAIVLQMLDGRLRVLCAREIQRSLRESVHALLTDKIEQLGLSAFFDINDREITCRTTGAEILFAGLWANINTLKSLENIKVCWIEEGESVTENSLSVLTPTIRAAGSEIYISLNPDAADAPVMQFIDGSRPDTRHVHVIFSDNPWFPKELESERAYLQRVDDDAYRHVWLGECRTHSDAQVFKGKYVVEEFTASPMFFDGPYLGADWGYQDPTTLVRCWVHDRTLFIDHEAYAIHLDIDRAAALFDEVPDARKYIIRADCARPETISYMQRDGYPLIRACEKWGKGFVDDGIAHIRSYERVVIHPRCRHTIDEFRTYAYKVDRLTGDVLPDLVDKNNHCIDALRYALEPLIRRLGTWAFTSF